MTNYVKCYNCYGHGFTRTCGNPNNLDCLLCKTHGDGKGGLLEEYSNKLIIIGEEKFKPPKFYCTYCKDTLSHGYGIYRQLPNGNMLEYEEYFNMPCHFCKPDEHKIEMAQRRQEVFKKYENENSQTIKKCKHCEP